MVIPKRNYLGAYMASFLNSKLDSFGVCWESDFEADSELTPR